MCRGVFLAFFSKLLHLYCFLLSLLEAVSAVGVVCRLSPTLIPEYDSILDRVKDSHPYRHITILYFDVFSS